MPSPNSLRHLGRALPLAAGILACTATVAQAAEADWVQAVTAAIQGGIDHKALVGALVHAPAGCKSAPENAKIDDRNGGDADPAEWTLKTCPTLAQVHPLGLTVLQIDNENLLGYEVTFKEKAATVQAAFAKFLNQRPTCKEGGCDFESGDRSFQVYSNKDGTAVASETLKESE